MRFFLRRLGVVGERHVLLEDLELQRLQMAIDENVVTPATLEEGMGLVKADRMAKAIDQVALAFGFENKPSVDDIYTDEFMPSAEDRMLK